MNMPSTDTHTQASAHFSDIAPRELLSQLYWAAVRQALPAHTLGAYLPEPPKGRTLVLGAARPAAPWPMRWTRCGPKTCRSSGLVVTRYGHTPPLPADAAPARIEVVEAAHPVPDAAGLAAAQRILALTEGLTEYDLVICLISGGGSSPTAHREAETAKAHRG